MSLFINGHIMPLTLSRRLGFPPHATHRFRMGKRRFRVGANGVKTIKLLVKLREWRHATPSSGLLVARPLIREVERLNARATLSHVVARTRDPQLRVLACWLRGRCGGTVGTADLVPLSTDPDGQTRKEAARALKRMAAWGPLAKMATDDPLVRIRRMATCDPVRPMPARIASFVRHVPRRTQSVAPVPYFQAPQLELGHQHPPKSSSLIRALLQRIQRLVGGHASDATPQP